MCVSYVVAKNSSFKIHPWVDDAKCGTARCDGLPWFSYHSADAVPIEGTVL